MSAELKLMRTKALAPAILALALSPAVLTNALAPAILEDFLRRVTRISWFFFTSGRL
jgi:hypothetical protein